VDRMVILGQLDIVAVGKILNGIGKREILMFHYKTEDIAPGSASEAVIELVIRIHLKRRGLLLVKWTQPNVTIARAAQMDRPAYHLDNVHCLLYEGGNSRTIHSASLSWVKKETANENQKEKSMGF